MVMVVLYPSLFLKMSENNRKLSIYLRGGNENSFFSYTDSRTDLILTGCPYQVRTGAAQAEGGIHGLVSYEKKAF
jgi:hypothetical protein